jgi:hypothetical protein
LARHLRVHQSVTRSPKLRVVDVDTRSPEDVPELTPGTSELSSLFMQTGQSYLNSNVSTDANGIQDATQGAMLELLVPPTSSNFQWGDTDDLLALLIGQDPVSLELNPQNRTSHIHGPPGNNEVEEDESSANCGHRAMQHVQQVVGDLVSIHFASIKAHLSTNRFDRPCSSRRK